MHTTNLPNAIPCKSIPKYTQEHYQQFSATQADKQPGNYPSSLLGRKYYCPSVHPLISKDHLTSSKAFHGMKHQPPSSHSKLHPHHEKEKSCGLKPHTTEEQRIEATVHPRSFMRYNPETQHETQHTISSRQSKRRHLQNIAKKQPLLPSPDLPLRHIAVHHTLSLIPKSRMNHMLGQFCHSKMER